MTSAASRWSTRVPASLCRSSSATLFEIASFIGEFRRSSFDVEHRLSVGGELAVERRETRVWAARDKDDPLRMRARPVPAAVIERFDRGG